MTNQQIDKKVASLLRKAEKAIAAGDSVAFECYLKLAQELRYMKEVDYSFLNKAELIDKESVFANSAFSPEPEELQALLGDNS